MTKYILEIYIPGSGYDVLATISSEMPFQAMSVGDYIDPRAYKASSDFDLNDNMLRIVAIQHVILKDENSIARRHHFTLPKSVSSLEETIFGTTR